MIARTRELGHDWAGQCAARVWTVLLWCHGSHALQEDTTSYLPVERATLIRLAHAPDFVVEAGIRELARLRWLFWRTETDEIKINGFPRGNCADWGQTFIPIPSGYFLQWPTNPTACAVLCLFLGEAYRKPRNVVDGRPVKLAPRTFKRLGEQLGVTRKTASRAVRLLAEAELIRLYEKSGDQEERLGWKLFLMPLPKVSEPSASRTPRRPLSAGETTRPRAPRPPPPPAGLATKPPKADDPSTGVRQVEGRAATVSPAARARSLVRQLQLNKTGGKNGAQAQQERRGPQKR